MELLAGLRLDRPQSRTMRVVQPAVNADVTNELLEFLPSDLFLAPAKFVLMALNESAVGASHHAHDPGLAVEPASFDCC